MTRYFISKNNKHPWCWKYQNDKVYAAKCVDNPKWKLSELTLSYLLNFLSIKETSFDFIPDIVKELEEKEFQLNSFSKVEGVLL